ncbi:MAG: GGDEF domain-containing protein [Xanthomonadales bacterium]|nr:GGDEF domain-containing protein [Xanthomonadales bacterium]
MNDQGPQDTLTTERGNLARLAAALGSNSGAKLVITQGEGVGREIELRDTPLIVGRSSESDLRLLNRAVSRLHCRVWRDATGYWLRDLNSTNRTYLNERPVVEARLKDGDLIMVGGTVLQFAQQREVDGDTQSQLYDLVTHDSLTGLYNRRHFETLLDQEIARSRRRGREFVVAALELDGVSGVREADGTPAAEELIKRCARLVQMELREDDIKARLDDQQLILLLPETPMSEAQPLLERLRQRLAEAEFNVSGKVLSSTFSAGAISWTTAITTRQELLQKVDTALYQARQAGRNRVVTG